MRPARAATPAGPARVNEYEEWLRDRMRRGGWSPAFRDIGKALGQQAGNLLTHLATSAGKTAGVDGWFLATEAFVENGLGIEPERQDVILRRLARMGIIEMQAGARQRHLRINLDRLEDVVTGRMSA